MLSGSRRVARRAIAPLVLVTVALLLVFSLMVPGAHAGTVTLPATNDAWIDASRPTQNKGFDTKLRVRASGPVRRSLLQFDVSSIPQCSPVTSADLRLVIASKSSLSRTYNVHRVLASWKEGTGTSTSGVSWSLRDGVNPWATAGGSVAEVPTASTPTGIVNGVTLHWNVTADVAGWVSGTTPNYGWLLRDALELSGTSEFIFYSAENSTMRPQLVVTYANCDSTPPTVSITTPTTADTWSTSSSSVTLGGTASDTSGVTIVTWSNSAGGSGTASGTTSWSTSVPLQVGTNIITVKAGDAAGNTGTGTLTITYTPPVAVPVAGTVTPSNRQYLGFVSSPFDLATSFSSSTALSSCEYSTDGGSTWSAATVSGAAPNYACAKTGITGTNGQALSLTMRATNSGGTATATPINRTIDSLAPNTTSNAPTAWVAADQIVTLTPSDSGGSGVASTRLCTDATNTCTPSVTGTSVTVSCPAGSACQTYVRYLSTDQLSNAETTKSALVRIDKASPAVAITTPTTATTYNASSSSVALGGSASDLSGVTSVTWSNSAGGSGTASGTASWSASVSLQPGTNIITVTARDGVGNSGITNLTVTYTAPVAAPVAGTVMPSNRQYLGFVSSPFDLATTFSSSDALTGCEYSTNGGSTWLAATVSGSAPTFACSKTGITGVNGQALSLTMRATNSGGTGTAAAVSRTIDSLAPATTSNAPTAWVAADQTVTLTPSDSSGSGVASTQFCTDATNTCTPATSGTSVAVSCPAGSTCQTYVRYLSTDQLSNAETTKSALVRIDKTNPAVAITTPTTAATYSTTSSSVALGGSVSDPSGVTTVAWSNAAGGSGTASGTTAWSASVPLQTGTNIITVTARDAAGNSGTTSLTVTYTAPVGAPVAGTVTPSNRQYLGFVSSPFDLATTFSSNTALTGCEYSTSGGATWLAATVSGSAPNYTCTKAGITGTNGQALSLTMRATNSGGTGTAIAVSRTIDSLAPSTSSNAPTAWVAADQTVTLTPSDSSGSGVASTQFCTDTANTCTPATSGTAVTVSCAAGSTCQTYVRYLSTDQLSNAETTKSALVRIDKANPAVAVTTPTTGATYSTSSSSVNLGGTASDTSGVMSVTWSNAAGGSGTASGTTSWSASAVPLQSGTNVITVRAMDAVGNSATTNLTVTYTPPSNTFNPKLVGFVPGIGYANNVVVDPLRALAYTASAEFGLSVVDVLVPTQPAVVDSADVPFKGTAVAVAGTRAVVVGTEPNGQPSLRVLDLTVPTSPRVLGILTTTLVPSFTNVAINSTGTLAVVTLGTAGVLWTVDISNPAAPVQVGSLTTPTGTSWNVVLNGTTAYVAHGAGGLVIVDVSTPSSPRLLGSKALTGRNFREVSVSGTMAYVADQSWLFWVLDVSVPSAPVVKNTYGLQLAGAAIHIAAEGTKAAVILAEPSGDYLQMVDAASPTAPVVQGTAVLVGPGGTARGVDLSGGFAYVAAGSQGLMIYNTGVLTPSLSGAVDDNFMPSAIAVAGSRVVLAGTDTVANVAILKILDPDPVTGDLVVSGTLSTALTVGFKGVALNSTGTLAVVTPGTAGLLWTVDISNPALPVRIGSLGTTVTGALAWGVVLDGTTAYVANGNGGLVIVDVSAPASPRILGSKALTGRNFRDVAVAGTLAYVADSSWMLFVLDVSVPSAPVIKNGSGLQLAGAAKNISVEGTKAAVTVAASTGDSLQIVDISSPTAPFVVGSPVLVGTASGVDVVNGRAFVAAGLGGLKIYDISNPVATPVTVPTVGYAASVVVVNNVAYLGDLPATLDVIDLTAP